MNKQSKKDQIKAAGNSVPSVSSTSLGKAVKIKGKTIKAKSTVAEVVGNKGTVAKMVEAATAAPFKPMPQGAPKMTVADVIGDDHFQPAEQWEDIGNGIYEAYAVTLVDGGMAKFTGYVKFREVWHDLRTFKEFKGADGHFYKSNPIDGVTLKVVVN